MKSQLSFSNQEVLSTLLFYCHDSLLGLSSLQSNSFTTALKKYISEDLDTAQKKESFFFYEPQISIELMRKILLQLGLCHDVISLTQEKVVAQILFLREKLKNKLSLSFPQNGAKFLLRVDDFPSCYSSSESFTKFHQIAHQFQIPYLLAITPFLNEEGLTPTEMDILKKCQSQGMTPALHGFTHKRTRREIPSELLGMSEAELKSSLDKALTYLRSKNLDPFSFVAPYNSYDPKTISILRDKFPILCGGPESVKALGYRGPSFIGSSLYLPSYRGAYDLKNDLGWIEQIRKQGNGVIVPITLHWANEVKNHFSNFKQLCETIQSHMISWDEVLTIRNQVEKLSHV